MFPWDWILDPSNPVNQVATKIYNFVANAISGVMSWVSAAITTIWTYIIAIASEVTNLWNQFISYVVNIAVTVASAISSAINSVIRWINGVIAQVWSFIQGVYTWTIGEIHRLEQAIYNGIQDVIRWIVQNVVQPVVAAFTVFEQFATRWLNLFIQYVQHPELLAELLAGALLRLWIQYVRRFGSVIARWLLHQMMSTAGTVFDLLEHILVSIL